VDAVRARFRAAFLRACRDPRSLVVAQNAFVAEHVAALTSVSLPVIRGFASYLRTLHVPERPGVLVLERRGECVLRCVLRAAVPDVAFVYRDELDDRSFDALARFRAVVLFPYVFYQNVFEEFYSLNVPLFMPRALGLHRYTMWYHSRASPRAERRFDRAEHSVPPSRARTGTRCGATRARRRERSAAPRTVRSPNGNHYFLFVKHGFSGNAWFLSAFRARSATRGR